MSGLRPLLLVFAGTIVLALAGPAARSAGRRAAARPDVLFIAVDDLNAWVGALEGHPGTLTPNMKPPSANSPPGFPGPTPPTPPTAAAAASDGA